MTEPIDRTPPNNVAAERIALGAMLISTDAIGDIIEILDPGDYYRPVHSAIHNAIVSLYSRGEPTDPVAVASELLATGDLVRVGGVPYLHECLEAVPTAANGTWYARQVADTASRRRLMSVGAKMVQLASAPDIDITSAVDQAGAAFYDATVRHEAGDLQPAKQLTRATLEEIRAAGQRRGELRGLTTSFTDLDALTGGLRPGQFVIVAGRPGMGKSVFAGDIARGNAFRDGKRVAFFSLEMSETELLTRMLSAESRVPLHTLTSGRLTDHDWERLDGAEKRINSGQLHIDPGPVLTLTEIRSRARRLAQREGLDLIVVDYLQLVQPNGRRVENRQQEVADLTRGLKLLAKELAVPVIAVAQLNRGPEQRTDKRPQLSDLRESGSIEQDADIVIFVHRDDYYDKEHERSGEGDLIVAKHRGGPTDTITVAAQLHLSRFVDMAVI